MKKGVEMKKQKAKKALATTAPEDTPRRVGLTTARKVRVQWLKRMKSRKLPC